MMTSRLALALIAAALSGAAQAALQGRDLNGDTVVDAFYDTDLDITWRRNGNLNGLMTWAGAVTWADNMTFGGYNDWRLPTSSMCAGFNCTGGELGHLWYVEWGNLAGDVTPDVGGFANVQLYAYWSGTTYAADPSQAWHLNIDGGDQDFAGKQNLLYAMAVRPGDVTAAIPEPETYALMLAGLGVLAAAARRRRACSDRPIG